MRRQAVLVTLCAFGAAVSLAQEIERQYGVATTVHFTLYEPDGVDVDLDAVCATGDVKISQDEGAFANVPCSQFTNEGEGDYSLSLTVANMQASRVTISVKDQGTKLWLDQNFHIATFGDESAQFRFDRNAEAYADSVEGLLQATVDDSALTPTSSTFDSSRTEATGMFTGQWVKWLTGANAGSQSYVTSYVLVGGKGRFTITPPTISTPSNGDLFEVR